MEFSGPVSGSGLLRFITRLFFLSCYLTVIVPLGALVRLFGDPLRIRKRPAEWLKRPTDEFNSIEWARKK